MSGSGVTEIARGLIRCQSVTPHDAGAQKYLSDLLRTRGLECYDLAFGEISNLFARLGKGGPHLCFAGHTDVVPPGDEAAWTYPPFAAEIDKGRLYGRGAVDMKGGVAAFVAALFEFMDRYGSPAGSVSLLITGDEEGEAVNGTCKVLEWMADHGQIPDLAIVGEPTNPAKLGEQVKTGRRGSLSGYLTVQGVQGHVAYQHLADNPLPGLIRMLAVLDAFEWDHGNEWFPPTNLEITDIHVGNEAVNIIPASGSATFNIRFNDLWTSGMLEKQIRKILDQTGLDYELAIRVGAESFRTEPGPWAELLKQAVYQVSGTIPDLTTEGGTSDARFIHGYCPVLEYGLINATAHQVDEHIEIAALEGLKETYLRILERFFEVA